MAYTSAAAIETVGVVPTYGGSSYQAPTIGSAGGAYRPAPSGIISRPMPTTSVYEATAAAGSPSFNATALGSSGLGYSGRYGGSAIAPASTVARTYEAPKVSSYGSGVVRAPQSMIAPSSVAAPVVNSTYAAPAVTRTVTNANTYASNAASTYVPPPIIRSGATGAYGGSVSYTPPAVSTLGAGRSPLQPSRVSIGGSGGLGGYSGLSGGYSTSSPVLAGSRYGASGYSGGITGGYSAGGYSSSLSTPLMGGPAIGGPSYADEMIMARDRVLNSHRSHPIQYYPVPIPYEDEIVAAPAVSTSISAAPAIMAAPAPAIMAAPATSISTSYVPPAISGMPATTMSAPMALPTPSPGSQLMVQPMNTFTQKVMRPAPNVGVGYGTTMMGPSYAAASPAMAMGRPAYGAAPMMGQPQPGGALFDMLDRNHDGRITRSEFEMAMR
mmetsp:Transcript_31319/g.73024  ORF Transcript_31319/g.73024 Transcript_31319/m.73024 type:complete len:440 (-) Transcript_31319:159-1478(-)